MKMYTLFFFALISLATSANAAVMGMGGEMGLINGDGRGGGDVVFCKDNYSNSRYSGLYTLDYLLTRQDDYVENPNEHFKFGNKSKDGLSIALEIAVKLESVSQKASNSLFSFLEMLENDDWNRAIRDDEVFRIWLPAPSLLDYKDEDFISGVPANCALDNGNIDISQLVLREDTNDSILYHYNRSLFSELSTKPLQMSYLLIHEWLRDYTVHASLIRRVNQYLHSDAFFNAKPYEAYTAIRRMGIYFDKPTSNDPIVQLMSLDAGVGCNGDCGYLDVSIKVKNVQYDKKVVLYYSENGSDQWNEIPAHYVRPLSHGYEEWVIQRNFSQSGSSLEFAIRYEVGGQIYWDNNTGRNYRGVFRYPTELKFGH